MVGASSSPVRGDGRARVGRATRRVGVRPDTRGDAWETDRHPADLATPRAVARYRLDDSPRPPPDPHRVTV